MRRFPWVSHWISFEANLGPLRDAMRTYFASNSLEVEVLRVAFRSLALWACDICMLCGTDDVGEYSTSDLQTLFKDKQEHKWNKNDKQYTSQSDGI
jgi:hypothetical protein